MRSSARKQAASDPFRLVMLEEENRQTKPFGECKTMCFAKNHHRRRPGVGAHAIAGDHRRRGGRISERHAEARLHGVRETMAADIDPVSIVAGRCNGGIVQLEHGMHGTRFQIWRFDGDGPATTVGLSTERFQFAVDGEEAGVDTVLARSLRQLIGAITPWRCH